MQPLVTQSPHYTKLHHGTNWSARPDVRQPSSDSDGRYRRVQHLVADQCTSLESGGRISPRLYYLIFLDVADTYTHVLALSGKTPKLQLS
jgi:hypothetical protein